MSEISIYQALINARKDFKPLKESAYNPFFKSKYADLKEVINSVKDALSANGLGFYQSADAISDTKEITTTTIDKNGTTKTETKIVGYSKITTTLFSGSGETITMTYPLIISDMADPQKVGSAVTYAKRYALTAALGIASEDDDAESAKPGKTAQYSKPAAVTTAANKTSQATNATVTGGGSSDTIDIDYLKNLPGVKVEINEAGDVFVSNAFSYTATLKNLKFEFGKDSSHPKAWVKRGALPPVAKAA
jgi:hypothetical protein